MWLLRSKHCCICIRHGCPTPTPVRPAEEVLCSALRGKGYNAIKCCVISVGDGKKSQVSTQHPGRHGWMGSCVSAATSYGCRHVISSSIVQNDQSWHKCSLTIFMSDSLSQSNQGSGEDCNSFCLLSQMSLPPRSSLTL